MNIQKLIKKLNDNLIDSIEDLSDADKTESAICVYINSVEEDGDIFGWDEENFIGCLTVDLLISMQENNQKIAVTNAIQGNGNMVYLSNEELAYINDLLDNFSGEDWDMPIEEAVALVN